jgi:hypothetical protein
MPFLSKHSGAQVVKANDFGLEAGSGHLIILRGGMRGRLGWSLWTRCRQENQKGSAQRREKRNLRPGGPS